MSEFLESAMALHAQGKYLQAIPEYLNALRSDPDDIVAIYGCAQAFLATGQFNKSYELLSTITAAAPHWPEGWSVLAYVAEFVGEHETCLEAHRALLAISPENTGAMLGAAQALVRLGRLDEAETWLARYARQAGSDADMTGLRAARQEIAARKRAQILPPPRTLVRDRPYAVVFTGQVRNHDMFIQSLRYFHKAKNCVEIVYSTWNGEYEANRDFLEGMREQYPQMTFALVDEPEAATFAGHADRNHLVPQAVALHNGVRAVRHAGHVLKTRPDVVISDKLVRAMTETDLTFSGPDYLKSARLLKERLCVYGAELTSPFYCGDLFFFGTKDDIGRMASMDLSYDYFFNMSPAKIHNRRFSHPFIHSFPVFREFFRTEAFVGMSNPINLRRDANQIPIYRAQILRYLLTRKEYVFMLMVYYSVASMYFHCFGRNGGDYSFRQVEKVGQVKKPSLPSLEAALASGQYWERSGELYTHDNEVMARQLAAWRASSDPVVRQAVAAFDGLDDIRDIPDGMDFDSYNRDLEAVGSQLMRTVWVETTPEDAVTPPP